MHGRLVRSRLPAYPSLSALARAHAAGVSIWSGEPGTSVARTEMQAFCERLAAWPLGFFLMKRGTFLLLALACLSSVAHAEDHPLPVAVGGIIVDEQGHPLPGVRVYAGLYEAPNSTHTASDGTFTLRLRAATIPLYIQHNGYVAYEQDVARGTLDLRITMRIGGRVHGRLEVPAGSKLPATVKLLTDDVRGGRHIATVAWDGRFMIGGFAQGKSRFLGIWAPGFMPMRLGAVALDPAKPCDLGRVKLSLGRRATVRVRDQAGKPVKGARVRLNSTRWSGFSWDVTTDATGDAVVPHATEDLLRAAVHGPDSDSGAWLEMLPAGAGKPANVTVVVEHPVTLHGTLVWKGEGEAPWAGKHGVSVSVTAHDDPTRSRSWRGQTIGNGSAEVSIRGAVPGDWKKVEIRVAVGKRWWTLQRELRIPRGDKPRTVFELSEITVRTPPDER